MKRIPTMGGKQGRSVLPLACAGVIASALPGLAQEAQDLESSTVPSAPLEQPGTNAPPRLPLTASAGLSEQFNTKIDNAGGPNATFSITRFNLGLKVPVHLNDEFVLANSFRYGLDGYNFNLSGIVSPPWQNVNTIQAASVVQWRMDDNWSLYGGGFLKMSADSDVALTQGTTGGILWGFNYKFNDTLSLGLGLAIASQLQESAQVLPLITAKWQFADDWRLDVGLTDVATMGYGAVAKWHFNDAWDFGFGVQYHNSRFSIPSPNGTAGDGVGQEKAATIFADATWHATPMVDVGGFVGFTAGGNLAVYDNHRDEVRGNNYDPAFILGVTGSIRF
jgi:long-subunit fatty acid transport protein